jgi:hypothetical protein
MKALYISSLIFLKEKSNREVKGRTCVNGAPQRAYIWKEDAHLPTVMTDLVFIQGVINAKERRVVGKCDLPGAFLKVVTDEKVIMVLRGELCKLMVKVNPKLYRKYVMHTKKGVPVLYAELYKSLYDLMRSASLFYCKLRGELIDYGFKINPYGPCVANKVTKNGLSCGMLTTLNICAPKNTRVSSDTENTKSITTHVMRVTSLFDVRYTNTHRC